MLESSLALSSRLGHAGRTLLARFLQGRHRAGLNLGDCMTYAVAKLASEPLLRLGDDFPATDLELA